MNMFTDKGVSGAKNDGDKARIGKDRLGMTLRKSEQNKARGRAHPDSRLNMRIICISIWMWIGIGFGIDNGNRNGS